MSEKELNNFEQSTSQAAVNESRLESDNLESLDSGVKQRNGDKLRIPDIGEFISMKEYKQALVDLLKEAISPKVNRQKAKEIHLKIDELGEIEEKAEQPIRRFDKKLTEDKIMMGLAQISSEDMALNRLFRSRDSMGNMLEIAEELFLKGFDLDTAVSDAISRNANGEVSFVRHEKEQKRHPGNRVIGH
jgi:hypothetical protein